MWAGAFTSSVGTWMQEVAQNWLILTMTGNVALLGLDAFLGDAPFLLFSLFGGVFADRFDRRKILLGSQIVQMTSAVTEKDVLPVRFVPMTGEVEEQPTPRD